MGLIDRLKSVFGSKPEQVQDELYQYQGNWGAQADQMSTFMFSSGGSLRGWEGSKYPGGLPQAPKAIYKNYTELRNQARVAWLESTETRAIVGRNADLGIHTGLRMQSTPVWSLIDPKKRMTKEEQRAWVKNHEQRWRLYFESKESDATGLWSGGQIQHFVATRKMVEGEVIAVIRYKDTPGRMSSVALQFYRPEQLGSIGPSDLMEITKRGNSYQYGIELTPELEPVAYYIDGTRIPKYGPDGRQWVIHYFVKEEVGQVRGISPLSPILHDLSKLTGYKVAELQAAVINASIAAWVEPGNAPSSKPLSGVSRKQAFQAVDPIVEQTAKQGQILQPGLFIQNLKANEKINSFNTSRPNVNFGNFLRDTMKYLAGSVGQPVEVTEMTFAQNYSASRATLILFQRTLELGRENDVSGFHRDWHRAWFEEEVRNKNIIVSNWDAPVIKHAWIKTDWFGIAKPDIDPNKTASGRKQNLEMGLTTHEREALDANGSEYDENIDALEEENKRLAIANKPLQPNTEPPLDTNQTDPNQENNS